MGAIPGGPGRGAAARPRARRQPPRIRLHPHPRPAAFTVPYANADEANHAPDENIEIERFYRGITTGAAILAHLGA